MMAMNLNHLQRERERGKFSTFLFSAEWRERKRVRQAGKYIRNEGRARLKNTLMCFKLMVSFLKVTQL
jgi:hypothetical protein